MSGDTDDGETTDPPASSWKEKDAPAEPRALGEHLSKTSTASPL